jgi:hypothetical protein
VPRLERGPSPQLATLVPPGGPGQGSDRTSVASSPLTRRGQLRRSLRVKGRSVLLSGSVQSAAPSQHDTYPY